MVLEVMGRLCRLDRDLFRAGGRCRCDSDSGDSVQLRQHRATRSASASRPANTFRSSLSPKALRPAGGEFVTSTDQPDNREARLGGIGAQVAEEIHKRTWQGHSLCRAGTSAAGRQPLEFGPRPVHRVRGESRELIADKNFGQMVAFMNSQITSVPLTKRPVNCAPYRSTAASSRLPGRWAFAWVTEPRDDLCTVAVVEQTCPQTNSRHPIRSTPGNRPGSGIGKRPALLLTSSSCRSPTPPIASANFLMQRAHARAGEGPTEANHRRVRTRLQAAGQARPRGDRLWLGPLQTGASTL